MFSSPIQRTFKDNDPIMANTPKETQQMDKDQLSYLRFQSKFRLKNAWDSICAKYGRSFEVQYSIIKGETDELDLRNDNIEVIKDHGSVRNSPIRTFGNLYKSKTDEVEMAEKAWSSPGCKKLFEKTGYISCSESQSRNIEENHSFSNEIIDKKVPIHKDYQESEVLTSSHRQAQKLNSPSNYLGYTNESTQYGKNSLSSPMASPKESFQYNNQIPQLYTDRPFSNEINDNKVLKTQQFSYSQNQKDYQRSEVLPKTNRNPQKLNLPPSTLGHPNEFQYQRNISQSTTDHRPVRLVTRIIKRPANIQSFSTPSRRRIIQCHSTDKIRRMNVHYESIESRNKVANAVDYFIRRRQDAPLIRKQSHNVYTDMHRNSYQSPSRDAIMRNESRYCNEDTFESTLANSTCRMILQPCEFRNTYNELRYSSSPNRNFKLMAGLLNRSVNHNHISNFNRQSVAGSSPTRYGVRKTVRTVNNEDQYRYNTDELRPGRSYKYVSQQSNISSKGLGLVHKREFENDHPIHMDSEGCDDDEIEQKENISISRKKTKPNSKRSIDTYKYERYDDEITEPKKLDLSNPNHTSRARKTTKNPKNKSSRDCKSAGDGLKSRNVQLTRTEDYDELLGDDLLCSSLSCDNINEDTEKDQLDDKELSQARELGIETNSQEVSESQVSSETEFPDDKIEPVLVIGLTAENESQNGDEISSKNGSVISQALPEHYYIPEAQESECLKTVSDVLDIEKVSEVSENDEKQNLDPFNKEVALAEQDIVIETSTLKISTAEPGKRVFTSEKEIEPVTVKELTGENDENDYKASSEVFQELSSLKNNRISKQVSESLQIISAVLALENLSQISENENSDEEQLLLDEKEFAQEDFVMRESNVPVSEDQSEISMEVLANLKGCSEDATGIIGTSIQEGEASLNYGIEVYQKRQLKDENRELGYILVVADVCGDNTASYDVTTVSDHDNHESTLSTVSNASTADNETTANNFNLEEDNGGSSNESVSLMSYLNHRS